MKVVFLMAAALTAWIWASHQYPETMHQVRLVILLLVIGGPDG